MRQSALLLYFGSALFGSILLQFCQSIKNKMQATPNLKKWGDGNTIITISDNDESSARKGESPFIVPFINLYYFWGLVPFQLVLVNEGSHYIIKKNKIQRIICTMSHCLAFGCFTYITSTGIVEFTDNNPATLIVVILEFISNITCTILMLLIIYIFWIKEEKFLEIVNCTRVSYDFITPQQTKILQQRVSIVPIFVNLFVTVVMFFVLTGQSHYLSMQVNKSVSEFSNHELKNNTEVPQTENDGNHNQLESITQVIIVTAFMYTVAMYPLTQGIFLVLSLTLRKLGEELEMNLEKTFVKFPLVKNSEDTRIREGIDLYKSMKKVVEIIKEVFGFGLLMFCIASISYYSEAPHILMGKRGNGDKATLAFFMHTLVTWLIAAEFHHHVKTVISKWIGRNLDSWNLEISLRSRLMELCSEANIEPIALQNKYFIVTYSYVCGLLSMTITYGLIVFQLMQGSNISMASHCKLQP